MEAASEHGDEALKTACLFKRVDELISNEPKQKTFKQLYFVFVRGSYINLEEGNRSKLAAKIIELLCKCLNSNKPRFFDEVCCFYKLLSCFAECSPSADQVSVFFKTLVAYLQKVRLKSAEGVLGIREPFSKLINEGESFQFSISAHFYYFLQHRLKLEAKDERLELLRQRIVNSINDNRFLSAEKQFEFLCPAGSIVDLLVLLAHFSVNQFDRRRSIFLVSQSFAERLEGDGDSQAFCQNLVTLINQLRLFECVDDQLLPHLRSFDSARDKDLCFLINKRVDVLLKTSGGYLFLKDGKSKLRANLPNNFFDEFIRFSSKCSSQTIVLFFCCLTDCFSDDPIFANQAVLKGWLDQVFNACFSTVNSQNADKTYLVALLFRSLAQLQFDKGFFIENYAGYIENLLNIPRAFSFSGFYWGLLVLLPAVQQLKQSRLLSDHIDTNFKRFLLNHIRLWACRAFQGFSDHFVNIVNMELQSLCEDKSGARAAIASDSSTVVVLRQMGGSLVAIAESEEDGLAVELPAAPQCLGGQSSDDDEAYDDQVHRLGFISRQ